MNEVRKSEARVIEAGMNEASIVEAESERMRNEAKMSENEDEHEATMNENENEVSLGASGLRRATCWQALCRCWLGITAQPWSSCSPLSYSPSQSWRQQLTKARVGQASACSGACK